MTALLTKVKSNLFIHTDRRSREKLTGEYSSVHRGRSLDFDDLRAYVPGDEVKDIDWKASARHGDTMIKRYSAERTFTVGLVCPTGRSMEAATAARETKRDIAILACGTIGYLALQHGDRVSLVSGNSVSACATPPSGSEGRLESQLRTIASADTSGSDDVMTQLSFIADKRRMLLFVIADDHRFGSGDEQVIRRLHARHDVLWLTIDDFDPLTPDSAVADVDSGAELPAYFREYQQLAHDFAAAEGSRREQRVRVLDRLGIAHARVAEAGHVVPTLLRLLAAHRLMAGHRRARR